MKYECIYFLKLFLHAKNISLIKFIRTNKTNILLINLGIVGNF